MVHHAVDMAEKLCKFCQKRHFGEILLLLEFQLQFQLGVHQNVNVCKQGGGCVKMNVHTFFFFFLFIN